MELTLNPLRKIIKKAGAKRVSDEAALELGKLMEERAMEICRKSEKLAKFSKRRTVMKKDIRMAAKSA